MAKSVYEIIKKQNGEGFAKAIRNYDSGIFDIPRLDHIVKYAGRYAEPIMQYLISLKGVQIKEQSVHMDPIKLLSHAGYDAYVADTLQKQNAIKKYFAPGEELCTFNDPHRFENYFIINAVRKDVDQIRRKDFTNPKREDKYGTSVLSIQVLKTGGFISIKNRYNHTVSHPDNTLNSNPDNIIPGLSDAIKHHFGVDFSAQKVKLPRGYLLINKQIIRFNTERNNVYCAEDFYVEDGVIHEINKGTQIMLGDGLMLDLHKKEVCDIAPSPSGPSIYDVFIESINEELAGKKLKFSKNPLGGRDIVADGQVVFTVENGDLVNIFLPNAKAIDLTRRKHLRGNLDFSGVTRALILENADLSAVKSIKLPKQISGLDLRHAKLPAIDLDFSGVTNILNLEYVDLRAVKSIKLPKQFKGLDLSDAKLPAIDIDFGGVTDELNLEYADLSAVKSIKPPKQIRNLNLERAKLPAIDLDFSGVTGELNLDGADLSAVKNIKLPEQINDLNLRNAKLPAIDLDFGGVTGALILEKADLSAVKSIKLPKQIRELSLYAAKLPAIDLDFGGLIGELNLESVDLSAVKSIKLPKQIHWLRLGGAKLPAIDLDFSGVTRELYLKHADLSATKSIKLPKQFKGLYLSYAKLPAIDLDFSGVTGKLFLYYADLSAAKSIKLPKQIDLLDLSGVKLPTSYYSEKTKELNKGIDALESLIKDAQSKFINMIKNQGSENE